jgi:serine phosphatase RsbU (regulator of sigma subunit)/anti-sigma regulatory factor (Ser/Thr protein kinase)
MVNRMIVKEHGMQPNSALIQKPNQISRLWRSIFSSEEAPATAEDHPQQNDLPTSVVSPVDISPADPILAYFQSSTGVVEIDRIMLDSPALREMKAASVKLVVPLISQGELIGLINLGPRLSEQEYSSDDRRLLENLAGQAAPALQVARMVRQQQAELQERERIEHQLRLARTIQQTLLPKKIPELPGWTLDAYYQPAWEVGGDFYDFIEFEDGRLGLIIGDVTDKGVPSALVMATCRSLLRASAERLISPGAVLERVNDLLHDDIPANMFVTCFYSILEPATGIIRYANAGHDLPYLVGKDQVKELRATGMPLGLMPGMSYEENETAIKHGEQLLLHSDGLAEAHDPSRDMYGFPRVRGSMLSRSPDASLIEHLLDDLQRFTGADWVQEDDVTLVTIGRGPDPTIPADGRRLLVAFETASQPGNERLAIAQVEGAIQDLELPSIQIERIKTAVGEATMNAMEHGNKYREDAPVRVEVSLDDCQLTVAIFDEGERPVAEPETPDIEAKLAGEQSPRGWGLFLIQHMVDELILDSVDGHHKTELKFNLEGESNVD